MTGRADLVRCLADGERHSGEALAAALGISRAAVWKRLRRLAGWGLAVEAKAGLGYRLAGPIELLDGERIRKALPAFASGRLRHLEIHDEIASTNDRLLAVRDLPPGRFDACLAEFQSAGRGRRGRRWVVPFGAGLCLSVGWSFGDAPAALGALPLACGVAVRRALLRHGAAGLALKWPNDLVHGGDKLGGILVDLRAEAAGPAYAVVGVGINVRLPEATRAALRAEGARAGDLAGLGVTAPRNALAASLIGELELALEEFGVRGMAAFLPEWREADALAGTRVAVLQAGETLEGRARGVDEDGALLLEVDGTQRRVVSGEVSVRPAGDA